MLKLLLSRGELSALDGVPMLQEQALLLHG
jgi:hypothetical protein